MPDRTQALAEALRAEGFRCSAAHDVVTIDAPDGTEAWVLVGADVDGYRCSFVALPEHPADAARAWARWTATVGAAVAAAWSRVEPLEIAAAAPDVAAEPVYEHAHPLSVRIDPGLDAAVIAAQERRFVVVREWEAYGGCEGESLPGPALTWHHWGWDTADQLGVSKGWQALTSLEITEDSLVAVHVRRVLIEAAKREPAPAGVVALDLRGLPVQTIGAVVAELVNAARQAEYPRGGVLLCDSHAAIYLARCVDLHVA